MPFAKRSSPYCRAALCAALLACSLSAQAASPLEVIQQRIPEAHRQGAGTLRMYGFHIYDAQLYVGAQGFSPDHLGTVPFALDLVYARSFKGAAIAKKGQEEMDDMKLASKQQASAWEKLLAQMYPDVKAGDHLSGVFVPGDGTTFYFNGTVLGKVPGQEFAKAFFSIWFDPRTPAPQLRQALLDERTRP